MGLKLKNRSFNTAKGTLVNFDNVPEDKRSNMLNFSHNIVSAVLGKDDVIAKGKGPNGEYYYIPAQFLQEAITALQS